MAHVVFSLKKLSKSSLSGAYKHDARLMEVKNADEAKTELNKQLVECGDKSYSELVKEKLDATEEYRQRAIKYNAVHAFSVVLAIPEEKKDEIDVDKWSKKSIEWLEKTFNRDKEKFGSNVVSAILHMDESSPHIHALVIPIDKDGHLNAYEFVHGPNSLREMQTSYAEEMKEFGLERGIKYSISKNQTLKEFYSGLNEAAERKAPEIEEGDTLQSYKAKCDEAFKKASVAQFKEETKLKSNTEKAISQERSKYVESKLENKELKNKIKKLERKLEKSNESINFLEDENAKYKKDFEGMEHELGESVEIVVEKVKSLNAMQEAIKDIEDPDEQNQVKEMFNNLIKTGKRKKRMEKKRAQQEGDNI